MEVIKFRGQDLYVGVTSDGTKVTTLKPICENIGIDSHRQQTKIQEDPKFNCQHMSVVAADGKNRGPFAAAFSLALAGHS